MSDTLPIGTSGTSGVRAAIARASNRTGTDFQYLLAQAKIESGLDPAARARASSAAGLYQFTQGTWLATLERHGTEHGLDWTDAAIENGRLVDPSLRAQVMALRHDPELSSLMAGELASDNREALQGVLGREPEATELYLAHFLGIGGASQFLSALGSNPGMNAATLMPRAAAANRSIFYDTSGTPRTVSGVMDLIRAKVSAAMEATSAIPEPLPSAPAGWSMPTWTPFVTGPDSPESTDRRPSMAETLRTTFGAAPDSGALPGAIEKAYGRLRSLGL